MKEFKFEITKHVADLSEPNASGWVTELNMVSWGGRPAVYDIRSWNEDHTSCGKGKTFTVEELEKLKDVLPTLPEFSTDKE